MKKYLVLVLLSAATNICAEKLEIVVSAPDREVTEAIVAEDVRNDITVNAKVEPMDERVCVSFVIEKEGMPIANPHVINYWGEKSCIKFDDECAPLEVEIRTCKSPNRSMTVRVTDEEKEKEEQEEENGEEVN
ncbi:MAG: hypothetical protein WDZ41_05885 [Candidatus Babeliales bacterium]